MRRALLAGSVAAAVLAAAWAAPSRRVEAGRIERAVAAVHGSFPPISCRASGVLRQDWWCSSPRWSDPTCIHVRVSIIGDIAVAREPVFCSLGSPDAA